MAERNQVMTANAAGMEQASANLDPAERARFDRLAASWWDPQGDSRPLHELNPARLGYVTEHQDLSGQRVVDVGCGGGLLSEAMARAGARVTGLDIADKALAVARLHLHESELQVDYQLATAEQWAGEHPGQADLVTCMEMLEHVPDPASTVAACAQLLRPGGRAFFSTLNRTPAAFALAILGAEYVARLLPRGTHRYDRFIRPSELIGWMRAAGLTPLDARGLHYNPLTGTARVGGGLAVNYLVCARKPLESEAGDVGR